MREQPEQRAQPANRNAQLMHELGRVCLLQAGGVRLQHAQRFGCQRPECLKHRIAGLYGRRTGPGRLARVAEIKPVSAFPLALVAGAQGEAAAEFEREIEQVLRCAGFQFQLEFRQGFGAFTCRHGAAVEHEQNLAARVRLQAAHIAADLGCEDGLELALAFLQEAPDVALVDRREIEMLAAAGLFPFASLGFEPSGDRVPAQSGCGTTLAQG